MTWSLGSVATLRAKKSRGRRAPVLERLRAPAEVRDATAGLRGPFAPQGSAPGCPQPHAGRIPGLSFGQPQGVAAPPGYGCEGLGPQRRSVPPPPRFLPNSEPPRGSRGGWPGHGGLPAEGVRSGESLRVRTDGRAAPAASALSRGGTGRAAPLVRRPCPSRDA